MRWIKDEEFLRGDIPMTKFEVRTVIMGILRIENGDVLLDIGAGTGSVSIEATLQGAKVYAVEKEAEGVALIEQNSERFGVELDAVHGTAPEALDGAPHFNKVFLGGSGKRLEDIVGWVAENIEDEGVIAGSFITVQNLARFQQSLKSCGFSNIETRMVSVAREEGRAGLMKGQNPIFIVSAKK